MKTYFLVIAALMVFALTGYTQPADTLYLWPGKVPGESGPKHDPVQTPNTKGNVIRLTDVTNPMLIVFRPESSVKNGAGVVICPGGGYHILAIDKEGYEIAEWLNQLGFTAFVLQYRVPDKQAGALMDVQRAMRMVRGRSPEWGLDPEKIGVMGFSAGGSLSARISTRCGEDFYKAVDALDSVNSCPDFALLIYPAYLDQGENRSLTPELKISDETPPMFIFAAANDRCCGNSALVMAGALRDAGIPVELHMLAEGGHGYGLRKGNVAGETWPPLAEIWLKNMLNKKK
jgi:acetyl esterase/lipase